MSEITHLILSLALWPYLLSPGGEVEAGVLRLPGLAL